MRVINNAKHYQLRVPTTQPVGIDKISVQGYIGLIVVGSVH